MRPLILLVCAAAAWLGGAAAVAAEDYVDQTAQFRFTVPSGWQLAVPDKKGPNAALVALISPRITHTGGLCLIASVSFPSSAGVSQETLNEGMKEEVDDAFWRELMEDKSVKDVSIVDTHSEMKNGRRGFYATARLTTTIDGTDYPEQQSVVFFIVPGRMHFAQCSVNADQVAVEEADIATVITSFEPVGAFVASLKPREALPAGSAALVLYSGPQFDGARRELAQDAPNLAYAGWNVVTASFGLHGYGLWQVCDRANYQGNCRIVAGAESYALGDRPLRIASARRIVDPRDPRNSLGVVRNEIAALLRIDPRQFRKRR